MGQHLEALMAKAQEIKARGHSHPDPDNGPAILALRFLTDDERWDLIRELVEADNKAGVPVEIPQTSTPMAAVLADYLLACALSAWQKKAETGASDES